MGKSFKRKVKEQEAIRPDYLSICSRGKENYLKKKNDIKTFDPSTVIKGYEKYVIRPLDKFVSRTKSHNVSTRIKELIRYAFNKYNPPSFLYQVWEPGFKSHFNIFPHIKEDFRLWFVTVAQGKSLFKEHTMGLLTKKETHYFSICPYTLSISEAIWYAVIIGMNETISISLAKKIASTKLSREPLIDFWKDVARWFIINQTTIKEMNDLLDYIRVRHAENAEWYIKDVTLSNLIKRMRSWHREMYRVNRMSTTYVKWDGIEVKDSEIERGFGKKLIKWKFHQITTGKELAVEGNKQHHCVSSYGSQCASGQCSIWSLTQWDIHNMGFHSLTIEVRNGSIVQARGYANRSPKADELSVLREWAGKCGFSIKT